MAGRADERAVVRVLVDAHGETYAHEAGIALRNTPQPLYRLLVLAHLLSARIRGSVAVATARVLHEAGLRDPAGWPPRAGRSGSTPSAGAVTGATTSARPPSSARRPSCCWTAGAATCSRLRAEADGDVDELRRLLQEFPGVGPSGAAIFLREVQSVWPEAAPAGGRQGAPGARRLGLPEDPDRLLGLAGRTEPAVLSSALVRAALDRRVAEDTLRRAESR